MDTFLNPVQKNNRTALRGSNSVTGLSDTESFIGYVFEPDGHYSDLMLKPGIDNLARFICSSENDKLVADRNEEAVLCTIGSYVDLVIPSVDMKVLLPILSKYQNTREVPTFEILS